MSFCVLTVIISGAFSPLFAAPEAGKWTSKIEECMNKREKKIEKTEEEYVCPTWSLSPQEVAFQVIMSLEFKKLDEEVKEKLKTIHKETNKDVGKLASDIKYDFEDTYPNKYRAICDSKTIWEAALSFGEKWGSITTDNHAADFVAWQSGECGKLVDKKIQAYKDAAWLLGESAIVTSFKNDKHDYMRKLKDQYEKFLNKWTTYLGQLGVIKDKWPSKSAKVQ